MDLAKGFIGIPRYSNDGFCKGLQDVPRLYNGFCRGFPIVRGGVPKKHIVSE